MKEDFDKNFAELIKEWKKPMMVVEYPVPPKMSEICHFQIEYESALDCSFLEKKGKVILIFKCEDGLIVVLDQSHKPCMITDIEK